MCRLAARGRIGVGRRFGLKKVGIIVVIVLFAVCGLGGVGMMQMQAAAKAKADEAKRNAGHVVAKGDLLIQVVESGTLEAIKTVEVKSRVGGRVDKLFVEDGQYVKAGELIAIIDPQETELRVKQDRAQLKGAVSSADRLGIEVSKRRITAQTNLIRTRSRLAQLEMELKAQPTLTNTAIRSAETAYNNAVKNLEILEQITQKNAISSARASVEEAESNLRNAKLELDRRRGLLEKGYISQREFESAELQHSLAVTRLTSTKEQFNRIEAEQQLERSRAQELVRSAKADLDRATVNRFQDRVKQEEYERAQADLRDAQADLKDIDALIASRRQQLASVEQLQSVLGDSVRQLGETEIRAPLSGVVSKRLVQIGELVTSLGSFSSGTPICRIEDRAAMLVKLKINEIDVAKLKLGMTAAIKVDAFPDKEFKGEVTKIAPARVDATAAGADPVVRYEVEVTLRGSDAPLKSGMSAKCTMRVLEIKDVTVLPLEYLGKDDKGEFVMVAPDSKDPKAKATRTPVQIGSRTSTSVQLLGGVELGTKLHKPEFSGPSRKGFMQAGPDE